MKLSPIFIIGNPRSGTTLLRLILHAHSRFSIPPEAGFSMWLYQKYRDYSPNQLDSFLEDMSKSKKIENWNINWDTLKGYLDAKAPLSYSELIDLIYRFYGETVGKNDVRWGDKNNFYLNYIDQIKAIFPNAVFLHIVRDGRNVACSYKRLSQKKFVSQEAPKLPSDIYEIATEWHNNLNTIRNSFEKFNYKNVKEIRLEDLTEHPRKVIVEMLKYIGEEYEEDVLNYFRMEETMGGEPSQYLIEWKEKNTKPIQREPKDKYKEILSSSEISAFNRIASKNLSYYNYQL
jgi:hypothetical protein